VLSLRLGDAVPAGNRFVAAIGNFDGVHAGHRYLIRQVTEAAAAQDLASLAITFWPHPRAVLQPERWPGYLTTFAERTELLAGCSLDATFALPFDRAMAQRSPEAFVSLLAVSVPLAELWVGEDFRFGHNRAGDVATLRRLCLEQHIDVQSIPRLHQRDHGEDVSSGRIRALVREGAVDVARRALDRPYRLGGTVVSGDRRGRQLGFPTANLAPDEGKLVPGRGVYAATATVDGLDRPAAVSIGVRPQFDGVTELAEAYILDFAGDLYGARLELDFVARLRNEERFDSVDALVRQMDSDVAAVRAMIHPGLVPETIAEAP